MTFKPGASGNPGGRAAVPKDVQEAFRRHTMEALTVILEIMRDKRGKKRDRLAAANSILDRGIGKAVQRLEGASEDGAIVVNILTLTAPEEAE
jgi:hypothetical protein